MVYFWQQQRTPAASLPSCLSLPHSPLPPPAAAALSTSSCLGVDPQRPVGTSCSSRLYEENVSYNLPAGLVASSGGLPDHVLECSSKKPDRRKMAERELENLNLKIEKLLLKMEDTEVENRRRLLPGEECVVCLMAEANMQTFPCGHKVVCRKCLIKTVQVAVSQRCLPLRCVVCRDRILRLHQTTTLQNTTTTSASALTSSSQQTSRPATSVRSATSPSSVCSLYPSSLSHSTFSCPLSPTGSGVPHMTSSISMPSNVRGLMQVTHLQTGNYRYTPTGKTAIVRSQSGNSKLNNTATDQVRTVVTLGKDRYTSCQHQLTSHHEHRMTLHNENNVSTQKVTNTNTPDSENTPGKHTANTPDKHTLYTLNKQNINTPEKHTLSTSNKHTVNTTDKHTVKTPVKQAVSTVFKYKVDKARRETTPNRNNMMLEQVSKGQHTARTHLPTKIKRLESSCRSFKHSQSVKVHPATTDHLNCFQDSARADDIDSTVTPSQELNNTPHKHSSASTFLARFLPKSTRRKCNWFRTE